LDSRKERSWDLEYSFLIIGEEAEANWPSIARRALSSLGRSTIVNERDVDDLADRQYDLIIVDAGTVAEVASLVARLLSLLPGAPVVVATASPTWIRARDVFKSGAADYVRKSSHGEEVYASACAILEVSLPGHKLTNTGGRDD
jgi:DNA-binding response OmpR family regulator